MIIQRFDVRSTASGGPALLGQVAVEDRPELGEELRRPGGVPLVA
jgi:hypothetical protein